MTSRQSSALTRAISLTDEILEVLEDENFSRVTELDAIRQPLIRQMFENSLEQIDQIKLGHLQNLNQQVVSRLMQLKTTVQQQQNNLRHASRATNAYQSNLG